MKNKKKFDSVKMMREIRDKLSQEFMRMTFEEQKRNIQKRLNSKAKLSIKENA